MKVRFLYLLCLLTCILPACSSDDNEPCRETASLLAARFINKLPELRRILATDVEAAYYGDPAATCFGEIISCYPAIRAISNYRNS